MESYIIIAMLAAVIVLLIVAIAKISKNKNSSGEPKLLVALRIRWRVPPCWNEGILYRRVHGEENRQQ